MGEGEETARTHDTLDSGQDVTLWGGGEELAHKAMERESWRLAGYADLVNGV